jgi:hypothetical protein
MESYKDAQWTHFRIDPELQKKHTDLSNYLKDRFSKEEPFITDVKRYNNYKKRNLNCSAIREDRENVLDLIKEN